jgi:YidC/Oxa1 family membrane protein insertase
MNNDSTRLIVFLLLAGMVLFGFNYFFGPKPGKMPASSPRQTASSAAQAQAGTAAAIDTASPEKSKLMPAEILSLQEKTYAVDNSLATFTFSNIGATLSSVTLKKYTDTISTGENQNKFSFSNISLFFSSLFHKKSAAEAAAVTEKTVELIPAKSSFSYLDLSSGDSKLNTVKWNFDGIKEAPGHKTISFSTSLASGIRITKEFSIADDNYLVDSSLKFANLTGAPVVLKDYHYVWGPNIHFLPDELLKIKQGTGADYNKTIYPQGNGLKIQAVNLKQTDGKLEVLEGVPDLLAIKDLYFVSVFLPKTKTDIKSMYIKYEPGGFTYLGLNLRDIVVSPKTTETVEISSYIGPAEYNRLKKLSMSKVVDLGGIRFLGEWMFFGLDAIYKVTKNWGVAILILTMIIRLLLWIPSNSSFKQMKETQSKMNLLKPRLETLKKIYKDDAQKLNEETMKLYQEYKINPLGGCLPMLLQIPIFIALYATLINMVELKGAYFALWWKDLSKPDPYFVLPLFMGVTMFVQQMMSSQANVTSDSDSSQKMLMYIMPLVLTYFSFSWPAGLMLYWGISNVLGIIQQTIVNKSK